MIWAQLLAYVTGTLDQELLLRNEYLAAENRILKAQITAAPTLTRRKSHLGGDRSPAGTKGLGGSGCSSATRYDSGLVSEAHRKKV
jgi:hypothetical protein